MSERSIVLCCQDSMIKFRMLELELEIYLCGFFKFRPGLLKHRELAKEWIFGPQNYEFCFNEVWSTFFDSDPEEMKKLLKKRYEVRYKEWRKNAKGKNHGRRRRRDEDSDLDLAEGGDWILHIKSLFD